jgi:hypothetical protein
MVLKSIVACMTWLLTIFYCRPSFLRFDRKEATMKDKTAVSDEEAPRPRDTFSQLRDLENAQNIAISNELDLALLEEVESLGLNPTQIHHRRISQQMVPIRTVDLVHNPLVSMPTTVVREASNAGMGIELSDRPSAASAASAASDSTVKWRDTMDVEFLIGSTTRDSEMPSWKPVTSGPVISHDSQSDRSFSNNSTLRQALSNALENASSAAKNVFSPAFKEFRFKDFCPKLFAKVRDMHSICARDYAQSFETTCKEKFSEGRSGAFMFFSSDQKHIVKTTTKEESQSLQRIMPQYVKYLEANPNSLIVRFLGSHCITMYGVEVYFVVMLNVFPLSPLSERYDLKGSWVNRHGFNGSRRTRKELSRTGVSESSPLFQDNDLQNTISLEPQVAISLAHQIRSDVQFLHGK